VRGQGFLEDINNVLNTGEVPNLFPHDEREKILQDVRPVVTALGLPETRDSIWGLFIDRVRDNLHICLAMSPVGDLFRNRCRKFPSLINCCTIDWCGSRRPSGMHPARCRCYAHCVCGADGTDSSRCVARGLRGPHTAHGRGAGMRSGRRRRCCLSRRISSAPSTSAPPK
jgi:hypothetical protein